MSEANQKDTGVDIPVTIADSHTDSAGSSPDDIKKDKQENDYLEQLQRLQAEFSNYRKRVEKERSDIYTYAKGDLITLLLPILDDFERMNSHHEESDIDHEGLQLIFQKLQKILFDEGVEIIPTDGEIFNPEYHEAIGVENVDEENDGIVCEEWQKGYRYKERLF